MLSRLKVFLQGLIAEPVDEPLPPVRFGGIDFVDFEQKPYRYFTSSKERLPSGNMPNCWGYHGGEHLCTFEHIRINQNVLSFEHFAVRNEFIKQGKGQECLLAFAQVVASQYPQLDTIQCKVHRSGNTTDVRKLAQGRVQCFKAIGATVDKPVEVINSCNELNITVSATWKKKYWQL
ncbi:hypothetical protein L3I74_001835 [Vibrio parahaemolyticus]|nr:hypothetical protein [Vibrio parahaemolyticus]